MDKILTHLRTVCRYLAVTSDVLTSVKKMEESLRRLRTARGTSSAGGSQGMSDDDKIRLQLYLDVKELSTQVNFMAAVNALSVIIVWVIFLFLASAISAVVVVLSFLSSLSYCVNDLITDGFWCCRRCPFL